MFAICTVLFALFPVWRLFFPLEIDRNEAWNAYHVDSFADVLADLRHGPATARTKRARRLDDPLHPRQMSRQAARIAMRTLIRSAARSALDDRGRLFLRGVQDALRDLHVF